MSTQVDLGAQTDILPTQNIGLLDQDQPQIYSLLANTDCPMTTKQVRRKKAPKLNEIMPVVVNPQIIRAPRNTAFAGPHHLSATPSESVPSFGSTCYINEHRIPFRFCLGPNSYDTNNNINNNPISALSMPLNPSLQIRAQQIPAWFHGSLPIIHRKSQHFELSRSLNNNMNERTISVPSLKQNECNHPNPSLTYIDQGSILSHSLPSPASSIATSDLRKVKPKRRYSKKMHPSASIEQAQHSSLYPVTMVQSTVSNSLPVIIPASVTVSPPKSEEHSLPMDISTGSNFAPLTPPASIKSPPTTIINEPSSMTVQNLLPYITPNVTEINSIPKQYFLDQRFPHTQNPIQGSSINNLSYNLHQFSPGVHSPYCTVPSNLKSTNILPITCSSILSGTVTNIPSVTIPVDIKKEKRTRKKSDRRSKIIQKPTVDRLSDEQSSIWESPTADTSVIKRRKHKKSSMKDIRTKKQLRRITRRNRLAVLKFMIRKRKQEKQQRLSIPALSEPKVEQVVPKLVSTPIEKPVKMERNLPDIIAPSLKITLDATQKIESIALYYHRRRKPIITNQNSPKTWTIADNKLDLLIEALEFMETSRGNLKLPSTSNK